MKNIIKKTTYTIFFVLWFVFLIYGIFCTEKGSLNPVDPIQNKMFFFSSFSISKDKLIMGEKAEIQASLINGKGENVNGQRVNFLTSSAMGSHITEYGYTDSSGIVTVQYTTGKIAGADTIIALAYNGENKPVADSLYINIDNFASLGLFTEKPVILADGISETEITAELKDIDRNPITGKTISFSANIGEIENSKMTNNIGKAKVVFTGEASTTDITSVITASIESEALGKNAGRQNTEDLISETLNILLMGIKLELTPSSSSIFADGISTTKITAKLTTTSDSAISSKTILFSTNLGNLSSGEAITDSAGEAKITITSSSNTGQATINAEYGNIITSSTKINFVEIPPNVPASIELYSDPTWIIADSLSTSEIRAVVKDSLGNFVDDGTIVNFRILHGGTGSIESPISTSQGIAVTTLESSYTPGWIMIEAESNGIRDTVNVMFGEIKMSIAAVPTNINADGKSTSQITATLKNLQNHPIPDVTIDFATSIGTIAPSAVTDNSGNATVTLTSERRNGMAVVTAFYAGIQKTTEIIFSGVSITIDAEPPSVIADGKTKMLITTKTVDAAGVPITGEEITLSTNVSPDIAQFLYWYGKTDGNGEFRDSLSSMVPTDITITAEGSGSITEKTVSFFGYTLELSAEPTSFIASEESTVVIATLKDSKGPISNSSISFSTTIGDFVYEDSLTDDSGEAKAILKSSTAGKAIVTVIVTIGGKNIYENINITINSAPPKSIILSANPHVLQVGGGQSTITAIVTDISDNPVSGATISCNILSGPKGGENISPAISITNENGVATFTFTSGSIGSKRKNDVSIVAKIQGTSIISNNVLLTIAGAPVSVSVGYSDDVDIQEGSSKMSVTAIVSDINGNTVVDGTDVNYSITPTGIGGIISPSKTVDGVANTTFTYPSDKAGSLIMIYAESGGIVDSVSLSLPGVSGVISEIHVFPEDVRKILADGESSLKMVAYLVDSDDNPVPDKIVNFEVIDGIGSIEKSSISEPLTDPSGYDNPNKGRATATLTSIADTVDRHPIIKANSGDKVGYSEDSSVVFLGIDMKVDIEKDTIRVGEQVQIDVTLKEKTSKVAIISSEVIFGASLGSIEKTRFTNFSGITSNTLSAGNTPGTAEITVVFGSAITKNVYVEIIEDIPKSIEFTTPNNISLLADGVSQTQISVKVLDKYGQPFENQTVNYLYTSGNISKESEITDANGVATITFTTEADNEDQTAKITASTGSISTDTLYITQKGITFTLSSNPEVILSDGVSVSTITADLKETTTNNPLTVGTVYFATNKGSIPASASISDGGAEVSFTSATAPGTAEIKATFGNKLEASTTVNMSDASIDSISIEIDDTDILSDGISTSQITAVVLNSFGDPLSGQTVEFNLTGDGSIEPSSAVSDENGKINAVFTSSADINDHISSIKAQSGIVLSSTVLINQRGITFSLSAEPNVVLAEGVSTITANLKETTKNIPIATGTVNFEADNGIIEESAQIAGGKASVSFTATDAEGTVAIKAKFGNLLEAQTTLSVASSLPDSISIDADNNSILADGSSQSNITATVYDTLGNTISGTVVEFSIIGVGSISPASAVSDANGIAQTVYTSIVDSLDKSVMITAKSGSITSDALDIYLKGITFTLKAESYSVVANGSKQIEITAELTETFTENPVQSGTVSFYTNKGSITDSVVVSNGTAVATLTSPSSAGTGTISAKFGTSYWHSINIDFYESVPAVILLSTSDDVINVKDYGLKETAEITAALTDANGDIVGDSISVTFSTTLGTFLENDSNNYVAYTSNGEAKATLHSGDSVGVATITARSGDALAINSLVTIQKVPNTVHTIEIGEDTTNLTIEGEIVSLNVATIAKDSSGNNVADGTIINFEFDPAYSYGTIESSVETTNGVAIAVLRYLKTNHGGKVVRVIAKATKKDGTTVSASTQFTLPIR